MTEDLWDNFKQTCLLFMVLPSPVVDQQILDVQKKQLVKLDWWNSRGQVHCGKNEVRVQFSMVHVKTFKSIKTLHIMQK